MSVLIRKEVFGLCAAGLHLLDGCLCNPGIQVVRA